MLINLLKSMLFCTGIFKIIPYISIDFEFLTIIHSNNNKRLIKERGYIYEIINKKRNFT